MLEFYTSNRLNDQYNTYYPQKIEVSDETSLKEATSHDYVCAQYRNNKRSNDAFVKSNCLAFDIDNDASDEPSSWVTPEDIIKNFPDVTMAFHYSRNNMVDKNYINQDTGEVTKVVKARPRFHVFFEIEEVTSYEEYKKEKSLLLGFLPYFDTAALDSARFFYGTEEPDVICHKGTTTLTDYLRPKEFNTDITIKTGSRNNVLSKYAAKVLIRYGNSEEAKKLFLEMNDKCDQPLEKGELRSIWQSALKFYKKVASKPSYIQPSQYGEVTSVEEIKWDEPLSFEGDELPIFPIDALPHRLRDYALAVSESTQTPIDMAAVATLTVASACMRNLYKVEGKLDWHEPTNLYSVIIAEPSERKSAVTSLVTRPIDEFIKEYNDKHKVEFEMSKATKQKLENKKNALISQSKKKGEEQSATEFNEALRNVIEQIVNFEEVKPLKIYVDDSTPEKLTETLADNGNAASIISSEGGIFDVLSGTYSNKVNIDVFLKAYSGENISVERIMRNSIFVKEACLTILLSVQPVVIADLMKNKKFRQRGLTARFLYSMPKSFVGSRTFNSQTLTNDGYLAYKALIYNILYEEKKKEPEIIKLTDEAREVLADYFNWVEKRIVGDFTLYSDWLGKLVGNTLRIAGVIARCSIMKKDVGDSLMEVDENIMIDEQMMNAAIKIGKYFLVHAVNAYGEMGVKTDFKAALIAINKLKESGFKEITKRDLMRNCRWIGSADEAQSILNDLEDYGYIQLSSLSPSDKLRTGRPKNAVYSINPSLLNSSSIKNN